MDWRRIEGLVKRAQSRLDGELESLPIPNEGQRNYYRFLHLLVGVLRPAVALEIGIEWGCASAYMAFAARRYGGQVVGVDLDPDAGWLAARECDNFHLVSGDSTRPETWETVAGLVARHGRIGVVFQDSSHHYLASKAEWEFCRPHLAPGAVWVCDDITPAFYNQLVDPPGKGMVQYWDELPGDRRLYPQALHFGNSIGVMLL